MRDNCIDAKRAVGIFDSGIGGLTVLRHLQKLLPHENFIYFADTAHLPYGEKSPDEIISYTHQILSWMQAKNVKFAIAACNTSSALALEHVTPSLSIPVMGMIYPMVDTLLRLPSHASIGILVTPASAKSRMHEKVLRTAGFQGAIELISCPEFVPLIEAGDFCNPRLYEVAKTYLALFEAKKLTTLVYGCTHYPWIGPLLQSLLPPTLRYIDPAEIVAYKACEQLRSMLNPSLHPGNLEFYCSSAPARFSSQLTLLMSLVAPDVKFVNFEQECDYLAELAQSASSDRHL